MPEMPVEKLDPRLQKQIDNARKAIEKNPFYAIDVLTTIVTRFPECLEARRILRSAQQRAVPPGAGRGPLAGMRRLSSRLSLRLVGEAMLRKNPAEAAVKAERMLRANPYDPLLHDFLARSALALELMETAAFAYDERRKVEPGNAANLKKLVKLLIELGRHEEAARLGEAAHQLDPRDEEFPVLIRQASVQQSIEQGGWAEGEGFRSKLNDEEESRKLEQAARVRTAEEDAGALIKDALERVEEEPGNLSHYRELWTRYRRIGQFDQALEWIDRARRQADGTVELDLDRADASIRMEKVRAEIASKRNELEEHPGDVDGARELADLKASERRLRRDQSEEMVRRYPNEYAFRYELGEVLLEAGEVDPAIRALQMAQRSPKVRLSAVVLLARAYMEKGFFDLAAEQLLIAKSELDAGDERAKDALYQLGVCYERLGDADHAAAQFKALYGMDASFRDVAEKVEAFYRKGDKGSGVADADPDRSQHL